MRAIDVEVAEFGPLRFIAESLNTGPDSLIRANCPRDALDLLIFFDSRGVGGNPAGSLIERILRRLNGRRRYLAVCRPLELTTWATLVNFLAVNELRPAQVVTNMGFVDFTPKKQSILENALRQVEASMGQGVAQTRFVEQYLASDGESLALFSMTYDASYRQHIQAVLKHGSTVVIDTPTVRPEIRVPRPRPGSFFAGLEATRAFNRSLADVELIDLPTFDESLTYDAVHYTDLGNELIFGYLERCL